MMGNQCKFTKESDGYMTDTTTRDIRDDVSKRYGEIATTGGASCCGGSSDQAVGTLEHARAIGYSGEDLAALPDGANLGLGCGNPTSLTLIEPGQTVVDLGSGAGVDCFIASQKVGPEGRVIGIDMTDPMLDKARAYADKHGFANVEFRKGVIEKMPLDDASVDLVISNCVINLSPDKQTVFREIARVLKPGGRAAISDIVLLGELPDAIRSDLEAYIGCIAGAVMIGDYLGYAMTAGLNVEKADRKSYDVMAVLGCSPEASKLVEKVPADFDSNAHVAGLDLLLTKPAASSCCSGTSCC